MGDDFKVGDVVERIGAPHPEAPRGAVARVLDVFMSWDVLSLDLTIKPVGEYHGWEAAGWRKLEAPRTEVAHRIRACRPSRSSVPA